MSNLTTVFAQPEHETLTVSPPLSQMQSNKYVLKVAKDVICCDTHPQ